MFVFFKEGTPLGRKVSNLMEDVDEEQIRGLGKVYIYQARRESVYFIPTKEDFSFNAKRYERSIVESVGLPNSFISLTESEVLELYPTGNVTMSNPLLHPAFSPRLVSPVDPDLLGTLWLTLTRMGYKPFITAVHDPPSNLEYPHIRIGTPLDILEDVVASVIVSLRRKKIFAPYITVSSGYRASYFEYLFRKRIMSAFHVPYYWKHFLDENMYLQMSSKSGARKILLQKGLVLPGELPYKEV